MDYSNQEQELLVQLSRGNQAAFEKIYYLYSSELLSKLIKLVKSETVAQEILQDVFLKIWDNHKKIDADKSFRSFLFKIAENKTYDFFRKTARDNKLKESLLKAALPEYESIETKIFASENLEILEHAIKSLPPQRQVVFRLSKIEGKSYDEIAEKLGITPSTISDHIVKATKTIREYFRKHPELILFLIAMNSR